MSPQTRRDSKQFFLKISPIFNLNYHNQLCKGGHIIDTNFGRSDFSRSDLYGDFDDFDDFDEFDDFDDFYEFNEFDEFDDQAVSGVA